MQSRSNRTKHSLLGSHGQFQDWRNTGVQARQGGSRGVRTCSLQGCTEHWLLAHRAGVGVGVGAPAAAGAPTLRGFRLQPESGVAMASYAGA